MPMDINKELYEWHKKIQKEMIWSDLVWAEEFELFINGSKKVCTKTVFNKFHLLLHQKQKVKDLQSKSISSKQLKPSGPELKLTKKQAEKMITKKKKKEKDAEDK